MPWVIHSPFRLDAPPMIRQYFPNASHNTPVEMEPGREHHKMRF